VVETLDWWESLRREKRGGDDGLARVAAQGEAWRTLWMGGSCCAGRNRGRNSRWVSVAAQEKTVMETIDWWELPRRKKRGEDSSLVGVAVQEKTVAETIDWWELLRRKKP
jgi:hypothetical protein